MNTPIRRNSGSARTALLCLVAAVVGGTACLLYCPNKNEIALRTAVEGLRKQIQELEAKAMDPKEVEKLRAQVREAAEFKKEAEEVHRLRGEVTLLRKEKAAFERASVENTQLREQVQQAQRLQAENNALRGQVQSAVQNLQNVQAMAVGQPGQAQKNSCIANLKQIDGATQQWALENRKVAASPVDMRGVVEYLKGSVLPMCPAGGVYRPGPTVSWSPTCTIPGHTL